MHQLVVYLLTANNKTVSSIFFYFLKYESETLKSYYMNLNKIIIYITQMQIISSKHVKLVIN